LIGDIKKKDSSNHCASRRGKTKVIFLKNQNYKNKKGKYIKMKKI
jgi:hypothetical protein